MKKAHLTISKSAQIILTMILRISNAIKPKANILYPSL